MSFEPSKEQKSVLECNGKNMIVSAQAGAGKTSVLVTKILDYIDRPNSDPNRVGVKDMLIVTFTKKAAGEMKKRIQQGLIDRANNRIDRARSREKRMQAAIKEETAGKASKEENYAREKQTGAERVWLLSQLVNLSDANIQTMHAFCLEVLEEHFDLLGRDPGFQLLDDGKKQLWMQEELEEMLEEWYQTQDEALHTFLELYGFPNRRNEEPLRDMIYHLYEEAIQNVDPKGWLKARVEEMDTEEFHQQTRELWFSKGLVPQILLLNEQISLLRDLLHLSTEGKNELLQETQSFDILTKAYRQEIQDIERKVFGGTLSFGRTLKKETLFSHREELFSYWAQAEGNLSFSRMPTITAKKYGEEAVSIKDRAAALRASYKELLQGKNGEADGLLASIALLDSEQIYKENHAMQQDVKMLVAFVMEFMDRFAEKKREENAIDFSDIEHDMVFLLQDESVRSSLQKRFSYIFFDEYQDANAIQDYIIDQIARENNLFFVGDIKQSIYRFRQAEPHNFIKRYQTYRDEARAEAFDLTSNFRSHPAIPHFVNFIFDSLMTEERGDVAYASAEHRARAKAEAKAEGRVEVALIQESGEEEEEAIVPEYLQEIASQAFWIAKKIQEYVAKGGKYKDCAILFRQNKRIFQFEKVLNYYNIPYYSDSHQRKLDTVESAVFIELLKMIDNGRADISLLSSCRTIVGGITDDELAQIRLMHPEGTFYEAMEAVIKEGKVAFLDKLLAFYRRIHSWRQELHHRSLSEFGWLVLQESGIYDLYSGLEFGEERREQLEGLIRLMDAYSSQGSQSLYGFLKYVEERKQSGSEESLAASSLSEEDDVVRLMTIHKSKGMEFPVVFVAEMQTKFNQSILKTPLAVHKKWGIALERRYFLNVDGSLMRVRAKTLRERLVKKCILEEELSETVRVLYVALTRAINQLYLVGSKSEVKKMLEPSRMPLSIDLQQATSMMDWIICIMKRDQVFARHLTDEIGMDFDIDRELDFLETDYFGCLENEEMALPYYVSLLDGKTLRVESTSPISLPEAENWNFSTFQRALNFIYPHDADTKRPVKRTVSEISHKNRTWEQKEEEPQKVKAVQGLFPVPMMERRAPQFLQPIRSITAAEWGTRMHQALQFLPLQAYTEQELTMALDEMVERKLFTKEERESLNDSMLLLFFQSNMGSYLIANRDRVRKEVAFTFRYRDEDGPVMVDGQMDLFLEKENHFLIIDFKTDKNPDPQKYEMQIQLYYEGLCKAKGRQPFFEAYRADKDENADRLEAAEAEKGSKETRDRAFLYWVRYGTFSEIPLRSIEQVDRIRI